LAIYNDAVVNTTAIWNEKIADLDNRRIWFETRRALDYPVLVAEQEGAIAGYGSFGDFRPFEGYRYTVEHSVYVAPWAQRQGLGAALLGELIAAARARGKHVMVAGIAAENEPSIQLHRRFDFAETAWMPEVGFKFGRWLDLVFMQKRLSDR
jgi:phosphinothricin acetyltransferase